MEYAENQRLNLAVSFDIWYIRCINQRLYKVTNINDSNNETRNFVTSLARKSARLYIEMQLE